jgi:hypothetical protein
MWPEDENDILKITSRELAWLLSGLDVKQKSNHHNLHYSVLT